MEYVRIKLFGTPVSAKIKVSANKKVFYLQILYLQIASFIIKYTVVVSLSMIVLSSFMLLILLKFVHYYVVKSLLLDGYCPTFESSAYKTT